MLRSCVVAIGVLLLAGPLAADVIGPGTNFMKTQPGSEWDFASHPIPAGTFGSESDAFGGKMFPFTLTKVGRSRPRHDPGRRRWRPGA